MEFKKILNELGPSTWSVDHLKDLIDKAKTCSTKYFLDKYHQEMTTMPRNYVRQFLNSVKNSCPDLIDNLEKDYRTFREVIKDEY